MPRQDNEKLSWHFPLFLKKISVNIILKPLGVIENILDVSNVELPEQYKEKLTKVRQQQKALATQASLVNEVDLQSLCYVSGLDIAYSKNEEIACAAAVTVDFRTLETLEKQVAFFDPPIPYIPSFLHARESPGYHAVIQKLSQKPDLFLFDGNGILHPLGIGLATQMGIELDQPSMGIAKNLLMGEFKPPLHRFGYSEILVEGKVLGAAFQSMTQPANPIFISPGHKIDLKTSLIIVREFILNQTFENKLPLPLILADKLSKEKIGEENQDIMS
ncbi:MAG: hypothetical protein GF308_12175 [Candidatus Heimdallarchaeota archaeon]|nr:hypothetical protein [Candidatus Heimdallarchaeota archaeon]